MEYKLTDHLGSTLMTYKLNFTCAAVYQNATIQYMADYYSFGKIVREYINPGTTAEKYQYTGKERDTESGYDYFNARNYHSEVGRFLSVDVKAANAPGWSSYRAFFCNPIKYSDPDGQFELPASVQKQYPMFTSYIKNNILKDVMGSSVILNAFSKNTAADNQSKIGNLTSSEVQKAVTWKSGPMIVLKENPGGMEGANGYYNSSTGQIELSKSRIDALEKVLSSEASQEAKLKALSAVYMTVLHETTHYGDYLDGIRQNGGEPGNDFENNVWQGKNVDIGGGEKIQVQYFMGDKYNPTDMQQIIDEKGKTPEGQKTFPTIPSK